MERSIEQVTSEFHIDREPFSDQGVSGLFYPGAKRQQILDQLLHLTRYGPPLLMLTGAKGSGKSFLVSNLQQSLDNAVFDVVRFSADVLCDDLQLIEAIINGFDINVAAHAEPFVDALCRFCRESEAYSRTPLLVIDDAQNLSREAVALIKTLIEKAGPLGLRILLLIDTEQLDQMALFEVLTDMLDDQGQELQLPRLNRQEIADYLGYRMQTAGLGEVSFSAGQMDLIAMQSEGVIESINICARQILVNALPLGQAKPVKKSIPKLHWTASLVVLFLLVLSVLINEVLFDSDEVQSSAELAEVHDDQPLSVRPAGGNAQLMSESHANTADTKDETAADLEQAETESASSASTTEDAEVDYNYIEETPASTVSLGGKPARSEQDFEPASRVVNTQDADTPDQELFAPVALDQKVSPVVTGKVPGKPTAAHQQPADPNNKNEVVKRASKVTREAHERSEKPSKIRSQLTAREQWLLSLNPSHYTLQLLGVREEKAAQQFIAKYPSLKEIVYYQTRHKNKPWFVVVYGNFPDRGKAAKAIAGLPETIRKSKPWPRPIKQIQQEIKRHER